MPEGYSDPVSFVPPTADLARMAHWPLRLRLAAPRKAEGASPLGRVGVNGVNASPGGRFFLRLMARGHTLEPGTWAKKKDSSRPRIGRVSQPIPLTEVPPRVGKNFSISRMIERFYASDLRLELLVVGLQVPEKFELCRGRSNYENGIGAFE